VVQRAAAQSRSSYRRVTINGFVFNPAVLEVSPGEAVSWVNDDGAPHSIAVKNGALSDTIMPGSTYSAKFDELGSYDYLCSIHPYMTGKILVTEHLPTVREVFFTASYAGEKASLSGRLIVPAR